jgi:nucleotide-binding universal stress UspA family protein
MTSKPHIILHPTDFSSQAVRALQFSLEQLNMADTKLFIIHISDMPTILTNPYSDDPKLWVRDKIQTAAAELAEYVKNNCVFVPIPVYDYDIILHTSIYKGILESIDRIKPYMVVIGQHGKSAWKEKLTGSTAAHLFGKVNCPLVIVP